MPSAPSDRRGTTLVELLVALAVMAVLAGTVAFAFAFRPGAAGESDPWLAGRTAAIRDGAPHVVAGQDTTVPARARPQVLFLPDGRAVGPGRDPLTGRPAAGPVPEPAP